MAFTVVIRDDDSILICKADDPQTAVLIETIEDAARLAMALQGAGKRTYGEREWHWAQMRILVEDD